MNKDGNLDRLCADAGFKIANDLKSIKTDKSEEKQGGKPVTHITKSLGVLQEDGVYAFFLYQECNKKFGVKVREKAREFLQAGPVSLLKNSGDLYAELKDLCGDLNDLLLAKSLLERTLIYARYHLKAAEEPENELDGETK